jgi:hypothetical protein
MRFPAAIFTVVACFAIAAPAAPPATKQPWEWTPAERAQARLDPAKRLERLRAYDAERRTWRISAKSLPANADVIDGARNPELYFATELFEVLVRCSFVTLPDAYPHVIRQRTSDLFKDRADWDRFAAIVAAYARVLKEQNTAANALDKSAVSAIQSPKHAAGARALREARRVFGRIRFDRMLYETVPVSMRTTFSIDSDLEKSVGMALEREGRSQ